MIEIDARCVLFNILLFHESIKLSQLSLFADILSRKIPSSYINISDDAIFSVIDNYSDTFILKENTISRSESFGKFAEQEFIDKTVNREFSVEVRNHLHNSAKEINNVVV